MCAIPDAAIPDPDDVLSADPCVVASCIPNIADIEAYFRKCKNNAFGEDRISGKLLKRFPLQMAILMIPLYYKACARLAPPLLLHSSTPSRCTARTN